MRLSVSLQQWAAWAPGLTTREAWEHWAQRPHLPVGTDAPDLADVPAMARRRIEQLGRMALHVTAAVSKPEAPWLFASRHGDAARSVALLSTLARGEPLSPTSFSLSVHNAVAGQHSITRGERANITAIAAGKTTLEAALVEACALLHDGHEFVGVTAYDVCLPTLYAAFVDEPQADFAFAWLLQKGHMLTLERGATPTYSASLPHALEVLRFMLSNEDAFDAEGWRWSKEP